VKDEGISSQVLEFAKRVFEFVDPGLEVEVGRLSDGSPAKIWGYLFSHRSHPINESERLVLNAMQRMSVICIKTNEYVFVSSWRAPKKHNITQKPRLAWP
jgi:nicotinate-nucleotide pyrophosphorylase